MTAQTSFQFSLAFNEAQIEGTPGLSSPDNLQQKVNYFLLGIPLTDLISLKLSANESDNSGYVMAIIYKKGETFPVSVSEGDVIRWQVENIWTPVGNETQIADSQEATNTFCIDNELDADTTKIEYVSAEATFDKLVCVLYQKSIPLV